MQSIIRRFDRAPLEDRLLRANPAQPPKGKEMRGTQMAPAAAPGMKSAGPPRQDRPDRRKRGGKQRDQAPRSAFAAELAKVL
jgi:hypothetical protein